MQFRKDINGLRAIAIISVMLFHFNSSWMPGGFAGVDVFFVISGFLMTGIIFRGFDKNNFSIVTFYVARANRIIPALAVLCIVLLIFGWFYLTAYDYKALGKHAASSITFVSNIVYWREAGYFSASSLEKWLLHTWSLSTEWQFYILYPLVLVTLKKFISVKSIKALLVAVTLLGFLFCILVSYQWRTPAYYLFPSRAWEMMVGGLAYLYPLNINNNKSKKSLELIGIALIIVSYFLLSKQNFWPGYLASIPVTGAFLIIQAQRNDSFITGNIIFQYLGKWSYSIYLWHWPVVVAIHYFALSHTFIYAGILLSVLLGFLSYYFIERVKLTSQLKTTKDYLRFKPGYMVFSLAIVGLVVIANNGFLSRYSNDLRQINQNAITAISDWQYPDPNLKIGDNHIRFIKGTSDKNILFIGASHIEQTYPYVASFGSEYNIYYDTAEGCFVSPSFVNPKWSCLNIQNYQALFDEVKFDKIVTSFYGFDGYLSDSEIIKNQQIQKRISEYNTFLKFVKNKSQEVFVILGEPKGPEFDPKMSTRRNLKRFITKQQAKENYTLHYTALEQIPEAADVVKIDPIDFLCDDVCQVMDSNFNYYYKDANHMRPWYAKKHLSYLDPIIE
ncbi:acyltransferase family protein [Vibrio olivae]|uniref:Acyltransferase family protein n=1 Tax=Vibrio olivae TaxID=1243002 RepID=A0ABV5HND1_9VIBR